MAPIEIRTPSLVRLEWAEAVQFVESMAPQRRPLERRPASYKPKRIAIRRHVANTDRPADSEGIARLAATGLVSSEYYN